MLHVLNNIPVKTTLEQAINRLKIEDPDDISVISGVFGEAKEIARPKAIYREVFVESINGGDVRIDDVCFKSEVLAMNLKSAHRIFAYVCTCGTEVDEWSRKESDYIVSLWIDMIKELFLYDANAFLRDHIKNVFSLQKISAVNPGSGNAENWPLSQQTELFRLIGDVRSNIGVTITDTYLMLPIKSTSGLLFPSETDFMNCALCGREICRNRRAEFDRELYEKAFNI